MTSKTDAIRALNDDLRKHLIGGLAVITPGVAALGQAAVERLVKTIAVFDDFCTTTILTRSTISDHSPLKVKRCFSKSTTTTNH